MNAAAKSDSSSQGAFRSKALSQLWRAIRPHLTVGCVVGGLSAGERARPPHHEFLYSVRNIRPRRGAALNVATMIASG
ncbi:hypothetical protein VTK26DRAFT_145 [Humicola hyalothermophila]